MSIFFITNIAWCVATLDLLAIFACQGAITVIGNGIASDITRYLNVAVFAQTRACTFDLICAFAPTIDRAVALIEALAAVYNNRHPRQQTHQQCKRMSASAARSTS